MIHRASIVGFAFLATILFTLLLIRHTNPANAQTATGLKAAEPCKDIEIVFARGSGGGEAADIENETFRQNIDTLLKHKGVVYHQYDLGTEKYGNSQYPHVNLTPSTVVGAYFSAGAGFRYGKSVDTGVAELHSYLKERMAKCQAAAFILAGYSQGAHVIGDTMPQLSQSMRDQITYIALFGDPKLSLPEGEQWETAKKYHKDTGTDTYLTCRHEGTHCKGDLPDACYGVNLSPWRHTVDNCAITSRGVLGPRTPYVSDDIKGKTHVWCVNHDVICGSNRNVTGDNTGHTSHYTEDRAIPAAAKEAVASVAKYKPALSTQLATDVEIEKNTLLSNAKYDVAMLGHHFCVTGNLPGETDIFRKIYADSAKPNNAFVGQGLFIIPEEGHSNETFWGTPESAVDLVQNGWGWPDWRSDANKIIYIFSRPYCKIKFDFPEWLVRHASPTINHNDTHSRISLANSALNGTPSTTIVYITTPEDYPIASANTYQYKNFFVAPYSHQLQNIDDVPTLNNIVLASIYSPQFISNEYTAITGQSITFSLKPLPATITDYAWDFDGDGITNQHTHFPTVTHAFSNESSDYVHVRATDVEGARGAASTKVVIKQIQSAELPLVSAPTKLQLTKLSSTSARIDWLATGTNVDSWLIRVNGFPVGRVEQSGRTATISDLEFDYPVTISVSAISSDGIEGEPTSATIEPNNTEDTPALRRTGTDVYTLITKQSNKTRLHNNSALQNKNNSNSTPTQTNDKYAPKSIQPDTGTSGATPLVMAGTLAALVSIIAGTVVFTLLRKK